MSDGLELLSGMLEEQIKLKVMSERIWAELLFSNLGPDRIIEFIHEDTLFKLYIPFAQSDFIQSSILRSKCFFEFGILKRLAPEIPPGAHIADIGANIGNHTVFWSKLCQPACIYAFEPQKVVGEIFSKNMALNNCENVKFFNKGVGKTAGRIDISAFRSQNLGATSFTPQDKGRFEVISLDSLGISVLDFVKIDVEGAQVEVLEGAMGTISQFHPKIFIELIGKNNEFDVPNKMLTALGYTHELVSPDNYLYTFKG